MRYFPEDPKKLRARLRSYERKLKTDHRDGAGKRFLIGPFYLLLGDTEGALRYYEWYQQSYSDIAEPFNHLCWALTLYRGQQYERAERKLKDSILCNLYLVSWLLDEPISKLPIWHGSNWAEPEYVTEGPEEFKDLWKKEERLWVKRIATDPNFVAVRDRYISLREMLDHLPIGNERSETVDLITELENMFSDNSESNRTEGSDQ
jgi:hypothetical protein